MVISLIIRMKIHAHKACFTFRDDFIELNEWIWVKLIIGYLSYLAISFGNKKSFWIGED
ncbi:MAG: hypothetical protein BWY29_01000 [Microgenomates group bacterium ADurb.Bin238]|nr:MAG: hypothetical protein BWY29_01000 [Microgenomates group bacterium ADurb.Bin238]